MTSPSRSAAPSHAGALGRVHAALGLLFAAWLTWHLVQQWPVLAGREAWVDRALRTSAAPLGIALLLALVLAHGVLGLYRVRTRPHRASDEQSPGLRRVQLVLGVLVLGFIVAHVAHVWPTQGPHASVRDVYDRLERSLGTPPWLALYLVGTTAAAGHLGLGLSRAAMTFGLPLGARARDYAAALVAGVLWLCFLQVLACLAIGEPMFVLPTSAD